MSVQEVNFNSTRTSQSITVLNDTDREDLISTTGPIKLVTDARSINVVGGTADTTGVRTSNGNILLDARGPGSDLLLQPNITISSTTGHITLVAADLIDLRGPVSTSGSINVQAGGDLQINSTITSTNNDVRLSAGSDLVLANTVTVSSGDLALLAGRDVLQQVNVSLTGGVHINAIRNYQMSLGTSAVAGSAIVAVAGEDLLLTSLQSLLVGLQAGRNIVDTNGAAVTVRANELSMDAGGLIGSSDLLNVTPTQNTNALDVQLGRMVAAEAGRLAARATNGMYIEELSTAGQVIVTTIAPITVNVQVQRVNFNSTQTLLDSSGNQAAREDLRSDGGPVKLVMTDGSLTVQRGTVDDIGVSTTSGNILLDARGVGSDLIIDPLAIVQSTTTGNIHLIATDQLTINGSVISSAGSVLVRAADVNLIGNITSDSGDVLVRATQTLTLDGSLLSTSGDVGLIATNINQAGFISTGGGLFIEAGNNYTMSSVASAQATGNLVATGVTLTLGFLQGNIVSLEASQDIVDGNDTTLPVVSIQTNIRAGQLRMIAGGSIGSANLLSANPEQNLNAIDLEVGTVAAQSAAGIYLQELLAGGSLIVGPVALATVTVNVQQVDFRSTTTPVNESRSLGGLSDLETTNNGPIKVIVENGSLTITEGSDDDDIGVRAQGTGDILLRAYGAGSDLITTDDTLPSGLANITSGTGHITLRAADEIRLDSQVSTGGLGTIYTVSGGNTDINRQITTVGGDIMLRSGADTSIDGNIVSTTGDVAAIAAGSVLQTANIVSNGNMFIDANINVTMAATAQSLLGDTIIIDSRGTITLGLLQATHVSLNAQQSILDAGAGTNVRSTDLRMIALNGSIGAADGVTLNPELNANAIGLEVGTVAAQSATGIYLQQLAGDLTIDHVDSTSVTVSVQDSEFRSTTSLVTETRTLGQLDDLETTNNGPIKVRVDLGSIFVNEGDDDDNVGIHAHGSGDILVRVYGPGSDITVSDDGGLGGEARITSDTGNITLRAIDAINLDAQVSTAGPGTIYMAAGGNLDINRQVTTAAGDMFLSSGGDILLDANLQSTSGDMGLVATGSVLQTANINTGGNLFIDAGANVTMSAGTQSIAGDSLLINSGTTITLGLLQANRVALQASQNIFDGNGNSANIQAGELRMIAQSGSIGTADGVTLNPEVNANAIDLEVGTVAAQAAAGIYLQELATGGSLTVGNVASTSVTLSINDVEFRSTTSPVAPVRTLSQLSDVETTNNSSVKVIVDNGSLTINEGADDDGIGVRANGTGDVLLRVYGPGSDIISTDDAGPNGAAGIISGTGNITLRATDAIDLTGRVATAGTGTIYMASGGNLDINRQVLTIGGDILLRSDANLSIDGNVQSTTGDIGATAAGALSQTANINTGGNVFVDVDGNVTMSQAATTVAGNTLIIDSGATITLGELQATNVSLQAAQDILDGNDIRTPLTIRTNVRATELRMIAGGTIGSADGLSTDPDLNLNAIDLEVGVVAAQSAAGIYLQELAVGTNLIVGSVSATSVTINVNDVEFRSTNSPVTETRTLSGLDDLETTNNGPIKVVVEGGSLTITEGNDNDNVGVRANGTGNILLRAIGPGSDLVTLDDLGPNGQARILSGSGHITLRSADEIRLASEVTTTGTVYMVSGGNVEIDRQVTAGSDLLIRSNANLNINAVIQSNNGDIGLTAVGSLTQAANISALNGSVYLSANGTITATPGAQIQAGNALVIDSGDTITLGLLEATRVLLSTSQSILDGNGTSTNIRATDLRMIALNGSIGTADGASLNPEINGNAIDLEVTTVAAQAATGIYLQQVLGNLTIGSLATASFSIDVQEVEFRSTTRTVTESPAVATLSDLETTNNGSIKVRVDNGSLIVNEGADDDNVGVRANGTGDILLRVYGAGSDIITTDDLGVNGEARITSGTGNITLRAADEISLTSQVSTGGAGTIYMVSGGNTDINRQVTTAAGDILLRTGADLSIDGPIVSTSGDIGAIVTGNVSQTANITTAGNLFLDATGNVTMAPAVVSDVGDTLIIISGGNITLGLLDATHVALNATQSIFDGNGALNNVNATDLRMIALNGSIGTADLGNVDPDATPTPSIPPSVLSPPKLLPVSTCSKLAT